MNIPSATQSRLSSLEIEGVWIRYQRYGSGQPILLTHGIPGDFRTLSPVAARLADGFEAITVSLPALPQSRRRSRPFGTAGQMDDVVDLIAALACGPVHLVAWSYSAHAAMAVAAAKPDMLRSLFVYEPGFPTFVADEAARDQAFADTMVAFGPVAEALARGDRQQALRLAIDGAAGRSGHFDSQSQAVREIHRDNADMLQEIFSQTPPLPLGPAELAAIQCPVTVARGADTRLCYRIVADEAARLMRAARHVVVPNAGHLLPEQNPETFAALVREHVIQSAQERTVGTAPGP